MQEEKEKGEKKKPDSESPKPRIRYRPRYYIISLDDLNTPEDVTDAMGRRSGTVYTHLPTLAKRGIIRPEHITRLLDIPYPHKPYEAREMQPYDMKKAFYFAMPSLIKHGSFISDHITQMINKGKADMVEDNLPLLIKEGLFTEETLHNWIKSRRGIIELHHSLPLIKEHGMDKAITNDELKGLFGGKNSYPPLISHFKDRDLTGIFTKKFVRDAWDRGYYNTILSNPDLLDKYGIKDEITKKDITNALEKGAYRKIIPYLDALDKLGLSDAVTEEHIARRFKRNPREVYLTLGILKKHNLLNWLTTEDIANSLIWSRLRNITELERAGFGKAITSQDIEFGGRPANVNILVPHLDTLDKLGFTDAIKKEVWRKRLPQFSAEFYLDNLDSLVKHDLVNPSWLSNELTRELDKYTPWVHKKIFNKRDSLEKYGFLTEEHKKKLRKHGYDI